MGLAWVVSGLVGFLLGVLAGVFQGRLPDKIIKGYSLVIASTPSFWLALLLLIIFGVWMKILPIGLSVPRSQRCYLFGQSASCHSSGSHFKHNRNFEYHITY